MWIEKNKIIARRFRQDLWNTGNLSLVDQLIDRECTIHARIPFATDFATGPEPLRQLIYFYHLTFSDIKMNVEQIIAEDDMVAVRWNGSGRQTGELFGLEATGDEIITTGIDMLRITEGRIAEGWVNWDLLGLLEQIFGRSERESQEGDPYAGSDFLALLSRLQRSS